MKQAIRNFYIYLQLKLTKHTTWSDYPTQGESLDKYWFVKIAGRKVLFKDSEFPLPPPDMRWLNSPGRKF